MCIYTYGIYIYINTYVIFISLPDVIVEINVRIKRCWIYKMNVIYSATRFHFTFSKLKLGFGNQFGAGYVSTALMRIRWSLPLLTCCSGVGEKVEECFHQICKTDSGAILIFLSSLRRSMVHLMVTYSGTRTGRKKHKRNGSKEVE